MLTTRAINQPKARIQSLDVFRGITILMMIFVNNPGSWNYMYAPFKHAEWNGWTPTDAIFPFFIFIMGVSIVWAFTNKIEAGIARQQLYKEIASRTLKLFGLGLLLNLLSINLLAPDYHWVSESLFKVRIMGVLQRLALVYAITSFLFLKVSPATLVKISLLFLAIYWVVMFYVPFMVLSNGMMIDLTGCLEPGKNFAAYVDNIVFGANHVYVTQNTLIPYDPEGILSTLPAVVSCIIGVLTGLYLKNKSPIFPQIATLIVWGIFFVFIGQILGHWFPINKTLWSPSYVFFMAGLALVFLAINMYLFDNRKPNAFARFFKVFGMNAIFFFMFSGVLARLLLMFKMGDVRLRDWLFTHVFSQAFGNMGGSLMFSVVFLLISYLVLNEMYRRKIFWKV
jgi:predicted acyltransferase